MKRYIALLRGVNVGGKNKIAMHELKAAVMERGFSDAVTYLNSGNLIFSHEASDETALADMIRELIRERFDLDIPVFVLAQEALAAVLTEAPAWWGTEDAAIYDNLIFVIPPADAAELAGRIGEPTKGLERVLICENVMFWSFDRKNYAKANWWKQTASAGIGENLTIRTANTLKKLAGM